MLYILLKNRFLQAIYVLRNYRQAKARGLLFRTLVMLIFPYWIYSTTKDLFTSWYTVPGFTNAVIIQFITLLLSGLFILLIISGVPQALHFNFLAPDNMLLSALPLPKTVINQYRFWEIYFSNSTVFYMFGLPVVAAAVVILKVSLPAALLLLCGLLLFLVIPTGLSSLVSILLARFLPVKRTKHLSSIIMGVMIIGLWAFLQFFRMSRLDPFSGEFDPTLFNSIVQNHNMASNRILPSTWAALIVHGFVAMDYIEVFKNFFILAATAWITYQLAFRLLFSVNNIIKEGSSFIGIQSNRQSRSAGVLYKSQAINPFHIIFAYVDKDLKLYFRDSRFVTQIFFYFSLFLVFPFLLRDSFQAANETFASFMPFTFMMFATIFMAGGLASRSIPLERTAFNYSKLVPNANILYITAKAMNGFILTSVSLIVGFIITTVLAHSPMNILIPVLALLYLNALGAAALGVFTGISFANFSWDNPRQMLTENGNIVLNLLGMGYLGLGVLLFVVGITFSGLLLAAVLFGFYTLVSSSLFMVMALSKMKKIEAAP